MSPVATAVTNSWSPLSIACPIKENERRLASTPALPNSSAIRFPRAAKSVVTGGASGCHSSRTSWCAACAPLEAETNKQTSSSQSFITSSKGGAHISDYVFRRSPITWPSSKSVRQPALKCANAVHSLLRVEGSTHRLTSRKLLPNCGCSAATPNGGIWPIKRVNEFCRRRIRNSGFTHRGTQPVLVGFMSNNVRCSALCGYWSSAISTSVQAGEAPCARK